MYYKSAHIKFRLITIIRRHKWTGWLTVIKSHFYFSHYSNKQSFSSRPTPLHKIRNNLFKLVHTDKSVTKSRLITLIIHHKQTGWPTVIKSHFFFVSQYSNKQLFGPWPTQLYKIRDIYSNLSTWTNRYYLAFNCSHSHSS